MSAGGHVRAGGDVSDVERGKGVSDLPASFSSAGPDPLDGAPVAKHSSLFVVCSVANDRKRCASCSRLTVLQFRMPGVFPGLKWRRCRKCLTVQERLAWNRSRRFARNVEAVAVLTDGFVCVRCSRPIRYGQFYIVTADCKLYHHSECSKGVPLLARRLCKV